MTDKANASGTVEWEHDFRSHLDARAERLYELSVQRWGNARPTVLVGRDRSFVTALDRLTRMADSNGPVLVTGETGTGKELFARALYLLACRSHAPFLSINCAQYLEGQVIASELFGHRKGSFTGAVVDHRGIFETANGGVVLLDEIGELSLPAQAMLLRTISEGEIVPVGDTHARSVHVRIVAATNRDLRRLAEQGRFRMDLYHRLNYLHLHVPPLRERGDDWTHILDYYLCDMSRTRAQPKRFSSNALTMLKRYPWPGNVREVQAMVDTGFHLSEGDVIEPGDIGEFLENAARARELDRLPLSDRATDAYERMADEHGSFWEEVYGPYMSRELSRAEVRDIVAQGLEATRGSYKKLLGPFGIAASDYLRFMDFLRHHRLKPDSRG